MSASSITTGPRKSVLKGKRSQIYNLVKNNISAGWFWDMIRNKRRGNNYALHNASGNLAGFAVMGKNLPNLGGSTYIFLIGARPGRGYGSQLLARIIQDAKKRKLHYIFLEPTEERVRVWYRRFGFTNISNDLMVLNLKRK
jgi:N-acetylglutamate synthase-like GNAT family acetyltransferase